VRQPRRCVLPLLFIVLLVGPGACAHGPAAVASKTPDVPYVPTRLEIVREMLAMAEVRRGDIVCDLGSGDGRILITAAREHGAQGVGYEIDPARVREAKSNARRAGVDDRVRFILSDIFDADLRDATVVTLYLLPDVNLKLKPKLLAELRPGTRVVSHNYDMGADWPPEKTKRMTFEGTEHTVYFWRVPPRTGASR
jgi:predicted O-methyltransferase YrrM